MNKQFKFYTGTLKAVKQDNARYIVGIATSTSIDRDNDRMSEAALQKMKATAENNLTIFTNHEYKVPDDLFGSCVEATIKAQKDKEPITVKSGENETQILTFDPQEMEIKVKVVSDEVNPKAGQLFKAIEEGTSLGFSVGGVVTKVLPVSDEATKKQYNLIDGIDLYEISIVSIPSNPDAMNLAISKSLKGITQKEAKSEEIVEIIKRVEALKTDEPEYTLEGVNKFLIKLLKKYYDEGPSSVASSMSPAERMKQEHEMKEEDMQRAKAQAENVLMKNGQDAKVDDTDDDVIHLRSHTYCMEECMYAGIDCTKVADHLKIHLKKLKKKIDQEETMS